MSIRVETRRYDDRISRYNQARAKDHQRSTVGSDTQESRGFLVREAHEETELHEFGHVVGLAAAQFSPVRRPRASNSSSLAVGGGIHVLNIDALLPAAVTQRRACGGRCR
jgi:hypothetical protein